ncbi:hypothetical protein E8E14_009325 [Neopestalotiopsis sp. 37M]|nr:hypothetical protein E8E14_009325 [Neopestalotiopsis sp. 37M]
MPQVFASSPDGKSMNRDHDSRFKLRSYTVFGYNYVPTSGRSHRALRGRVE